MKADFLFVGLNLNPIVQEKTPETCTSHGWFFKNKKSRSIQNSKNNITETKMLNQIHNRHQRNTDDGGKATASPHW